MTGSAATARPARLAPYRARRRLGILVVAGVTAVLAGCGEGATRDSADTTAPAELPATTGGASTASGPQRPLADAVRSLPAAPAVPDVPAEGPAPTGLTIDAIDVSAAPVRPVGVEGDGDMEIPEADEVGWYRFGSRPGEDGATVLAAHIAYDGVDGVFRRLADLRPGDAVSVHLSDGEVRRFVVTALAQHRKEELPDEVFARGGDPQLVLITCGGEFDDEARRYRDNIVAFARPA